ncbi:hypothetical protein [Caballeronia calidae]|uniref:hypothetical protein n=1 Tax=Caballeronia calidae TaxID=1777139 RepID=UPI0018DF501C|nr:hypothetical protein [Caballeronia calidae]
MNTRIWRSRNSELAGAKETANGTMTAFSHPKKKWLLALARKQPLSHCPENPPMRGAERPSADFGQDDAAVLTCPA